MGGLLGLLAAVALMHGCSTSVPSAQAPTEVASGPSAPSIVPTTAEPSPVVTPTGAAVEIKRGVVYSTIDAGGTPLDLELDLYVPVEGSPAPLLVDIHGGGWAEGEREGCVIAQLVAAGYAVACIDYRLAREDCAAWARFPGAVLDVRTAVDWLREHAAAYRLDPARIALIGGSAGGHLAALTGLSYGVPSLATSEGASSPPVQAIVDFFGPSDLLAEPLQFEESPCDTSLEALQAKHGGDIGWTWYASLFLGGGFGDPAVVERAKLAAPGRYGDPADPPILVIHGEADSTVPIHQSELLADRLEAAEVDVTFLRFPGFDHTFSPPTGRQDSIAREFLEPTLEFLDRAFGTVARAEVSAAG
jgi:acetyl esterase/lipase